MTSSTALRLIQPAGIVALLLIGVAMLMYPGGTLLNPSTRGYSIFHNSLSDLGSTVAWNGQPNPVGSLFHLAACLLLVFAGLGCFAALIRAYSSSTRTTRLARTAGALVLLAAMGLAGAALSPQDRYPALHGRFTLMAVCSFPLATALLALATAFDGRFRRRASVGWLVLTLVVVAWVSVMPSRPTTDLQLAIPVTLQKVVAITLLLTLTVESFEARRVTGARNGAAV